MSLEVGSTLGDYEILAVLGAGGMGQVYKVRNVISDRVEAMKILLPDLAHEAELADRFMREIKVQASLEHPNIAALHTALRVGNQLLMLMELVEGETLDQKLRTGALGVSDAVEYIGQVLAALGYAHERGVVHRDIKPANMMLTPAGTIKLMDFGIAKAASDRKLTMTGTTMGSLYYMSPEQIKGVGIDARSDLYSVGVTLYELVTGKRPFDGDSQFAIMAAHLEKEPVPPVSIDARLPAALNDLILMSVAKDPNGRFQTAEAFRNGLLSVAAGLPRAAAAKPAAQDFRLIEPTPSQPARSRRGLWVAAGALCTALAVVALVQFGPWRRTIAAPQEPAAVQSPAQPQSQFPAEPPAAQPEAGQTMMQEAPVQVPAALVAPPGQATPAGGKMPAPVRENRPAPVQKVAAPRAAPAAAGQSVADPQPNMPAQQPPVPQPNMAAQRPALDEAGRAELQEVREQLVMLGTRASAIRSSLQNLQRSQAAAGVGLRGDMTESASLMNTYLDGAKSALEAGDAASARAFMDKGERQIERLEKFLGR
jgi:serine/threonine-protein kinase